MSYENNEDNGIPNISEDYQTFDKYLYNNSISTIKKNSENNNTNQFFTEEREIEVIESYHCRNCLTFPLLEILNKNIVKIKCTDNCDSEISFENVHKYIIKQIKLNKVKKMMEKLGCRTHKKVFESFCTICKKNLCDDCYKQHHHEKDHLDKKKLLLSFNELNEESKKKEKYIENYFLDFLKREYDNNNNINNSEIQSEKDTEKEEYIRNQNGKTILIKKEEKDILEIVYKINNIMKLYDAVISSKKYFPNYSHFFNIDKIYFFLLDKIEIKYFAQTPKKIRLFGKKFVENNLNKCFLIIDGKEFELCEYYKKENQELKELTIILVKKKPIENMTEMFKNCKCLTSVIKKQWREQKVINMSYMFCGCEKLNELDFFSEINVSEVKDFSYMFNKCNSLKAINEPLNFNIAKAEKLNCMFNECQLLEKIDGISEFITDNVEDMSSMFNECKKLKEIDLSGWNFSKVRDVSKLFKDCESLEVVKLNENQNSNVINMEYMFANCKNLKIIDGLSKWKTEKVKFMNNMFCNCSSLETFSDISNWDINNVEDTFNDMFLNCSDKVKIPFWYYD